MFLRRLKYFRIAAERKSFSRAAMQLRITQPTLSNHIKCLEEELEVSLFHRDGRGVCLTDAGAELYRCANRIELQIHSTLEVLKKYKKNPFREVAIGAPPSIGPQFLPEVAAIIREQNPDITLRVLEGFSEQLADWLQTGRVDVAILYEVHTHTNIEVRMTFNERLCLIAAPGHPLTKNMTVSLENLSTETILSQGLPSTIRNCLENLAKVNNIKLNYAMEIDSISTLKAMVSSGIGCTVLPVAAAVGEIERGELTFAEIVDPPVQLELAVGVSTLGKVSQEVYPICDILHDYVAAQITDGVWNANLTKV